MIESGELLLQNLAEISSKPVEWAWESFIPMGKLTLLAGDSGAGKSLIALQVAAMVTRGEMNPIPMVRELKTVSTEATLRPGPSEQPRAAQGQALNPSTVAGLRPRAVIVLSAEDSTEDTVLPRLTAAGADVSRVYVLRTQGMGIQSEGVDSGLHRVGSAEQGQAPGTEPVPFPQTFSLCRDWSRLQAALRQLKGAGVDVGLIIVDPIERFLSPSDTKKEKLELVSRLTDLAAESGAAVLVVGNASLKAGTGSRPAVFQELYHSARSVLLVAQDLDDKDLKLVLPVKLNLAALPPAWGFLVNEGFVQWRAERLAITGEDYLYQCQIKQKNPLVREEVYEIQRVTKWLKGVLTAGRASSLWIRSSAAHVDIAYGTLRRAFKLLGCRSFRVNNQWFWCLPGGDAPADQESLEEPIETPEGEIIGVYRESMPHWLQQENAELAAEAARQAALRGVVPAPSVAREGTQQADARMMQVPSYGYWLGGVYYPGQIETVPLPETPSARPAMPSEGEGYVPDWVR